jgi:5-methylcytosine-specific restriction endonuclease McrA
MSKEENELIRKLYQRCVELNELWGTDFVVDHLQPLAAGGKHEWTNLMLLDGALNYRKMDSWPWSYEIMVRNGAVIERHIRT